MYQKLAVNEYGEPMYVENVMDAQEEYDAYCEEMQMRADDPHYAACREDEEWFERAKSCFENQGIKVPHSVIETLKNELRRRDRERKEQAEIAKAQPFVDLVNKIIPNCNAIACYYPETPVECDYVEVHFENEPCREDMEKVFEAAALDEKYNYIEDYIPSPSCFKTRSEQHFRKFSCKIQQEVIFKHELGSHIHAHAEFDGKVIKEIWWDVETRKQMVLLDGDNEPKRLENYGDYIETIYEQIITK